MGEDPGGPSHDAAAGAPERADVAAARRAADAGLAAGAIDRHQAEALVVLAAAGDEALEAAARRTLGGELAAATRVLVDAANAAAVRLEDQDSGSDLEELAAVVARLGQEVLRLRARAYEPGQAAAGSGLLASDSWRAALEAATHHLREARDLIDDGMPADTAAFKVLAARDALDSALA